MPDGYGGGQMDPQVLQMIMALAGRGQGEDSNMTGPGIGQLNQSQVNGLPNALGQYGAMPTGPAGLGGTASGPADPYGPMMSPPPMTPPPQGLF